MRILLACELYHPSVGGVQEVMRQVAERLVRRGHVVTVATSYLPERRDHVQNGVEIVDFKVSGNAVRGLTGEIDRYRRYVLEAGYDVFMIKAAQQWTFDALLPVLDRVRGPKIFVPCGFSALYEPAYADYYRTMPSALSEFDHLIFYASKYRDIDMARQNGLSRFSIVPNGASEREFNTERDPGFRARIGVDEDAFVLLTVGTLTGGMKGHRELAEAFALAKMPALRSVLVLNGNVVTDSSRVRPSARLRAGVSLLRRGVGRVVRLARQRGRVRGATAETLSALVRRINGFSPQKQAMITNLARGELVQAYLNSDLFVFASNVEYSPLVLYEAAAAGLPFLTVPVGNAAEIAQWTGGGMVCPAPRDDRGYTRVQPAILAEHIATLARDPSSLKALGRAGRQAWSERFTWATITDKYEAIFADEVERAGR